MTIKPRYHDYFGETTMEIEPYIGENWYSAEPREQWAELKRRMRYLKGEAEWRSVIDDDTDRKAAIIYLNHSNMERWVDRAGEHELRFEPIRYTEPYEGFSHTHYPTDPDDPERIVYAAIGENQDVVDKMKEAEKNMESADKHEVVGELLGFPSCCRDFFNDVWLGEGGLNGVDMSEGRRDPIYEITCNTPSAERRYYNEDEETIVIKDGSPWNNIMWRYFGIGFLTHMPCSWECEKAEEVAIERAWIMNELDREAGQAMKEWLDMNQKFTSHNGIATVTNGLMKGQTQTDTYFNKKRILWNEEPDPVGEKPGKGGEFSAQ